MMRLTARPPTFDELRAERRPCSRRRHWLTGDQDQHLICPHCGPDRPTGRWGARWAQDDEGTVHE